MSVARFSEQWLADRLGAANPPSFLDAVATNGCKASVSVSAPVVDVAPTSEGWPMFEAMLRSARLPLPIYELRFDPVRKWRFDMAWLQPRKVAIEVNGGVWSGGRHTRGDGYLRDMEKLNAAQLAGWVVLQYAPDNLARAVDDLQTILGSADGTAINSAA